MSTINSNNLSWLRRLIRSTKPLRDLIGDVAQFSLVIDANCIIGDLIWLTKKRKNPESKTQIQECIIAGTFIIYCTKTVIKEVDKYLESIAEKNNIPIISIKNEWECYKSLLKVKEPDNISVNKYKNGVDPDDAPTLALAEIISAVGIISKDPHIKSMGGKALSARSINDKGVLEFEFCASARDYSRKATASLMLRVGGYYSLFIGIELFNVFLNMIKKIIAWIGKLPGWVKILLIVAALLAFFIFEFKEFIFNLIKSIISKFKESIPQILDLIEKIETILEKNKPTVPIIKYI
ncbi:MAG: PIN domain-containing protein [bacterium]